MWRLIWSINDEVEESFIFPHAASSMANILNSVYRWAVPAGAAFALANAAMYDVKGGSRAVIFDRLAGVKENVVQEGTHFLIPWLQRPIVFDIRTKPRNISTTTGSKDLQMVSLTLRVLHRPEVRLLPKIYQVCTATFSISTGDCEEREADGSAESRLRLR